MSPSTVIVLPELTILAAIILEQIKEMSDGSISISEPTVDTDLLAMGMDSMDIAELELELENCYDWAINKRIYLEKSDTPTSIAGKIKVLHTSL